MRRDNFSVKMTAALAAYTQREGESRSAAIARCAVAHGVSVSGLLRALKAATPESAPTGSPQALPQNQ